MEFQQRNMSLFHYESVSKWLSTEPVWRMQYTYIFTANAIVIIKC